LPKVKINWDIFFAEEKQNVSFFKSWWETKRGMQQEWEH
jgi:hypothetical protein